MYWTLALSFFASFTRCSGSKTTVCHFSTVLMLLTRNKRPPCRSYSFSLGYLDLKPKMCEGDDRQVLHRTDRHQMGTNDDANTDIHETSAISQSLCSLTKERTAPPSSFANRFATAKSILVLAAFLDRVKPLPRV